VFGANGGLRDLVYVRMPNNTTRGIPGWMFDESICASVRCADRAIIDCQALLRLAQLLHLQLLRGEVLTIVPVGFVRSHSNRIEMTPDREVQEAVRLVFSDFERLGTLRQVLL
jgi:hypothetical protein